MTTRWRGALAGVLMVVICAGWFTLSRHGARSSLTPYDITALRFGSACVVTSPLWWSYPWRRVRWGRALVVALGCGFPYTLLAFHGLRITGAAEGGVWVNGSLPALSALLSVVWLRERPARHLWLTCLLVLAGNLFVSGYGSSAAPRGGEHVLAIAQLMLAAAVLAVYMAAVRAWKLGLRDVLVLVPLLNSVCFLPLWWFVLPSSLGSASASDIWVQTLYQGVLVSVLGLVFFTDCIKSLGSVASALFMACVPAVTALTALLTLGEALSPWQLAGIGLCSAALIQHALRPASAEPARTEPVITEPVIAASRALEGPPAHAPTGL